jgi:sugar O-acyltransferase (sialic acid O-acetyltransferase NeuD family)
MKKIVLFGNSLYAESIYFSLTYDSPFKVAGFTVDRKYINEDTLFGMPVVPFEDVESIFSPTEHDMLLALSYQRLNRLREEKYYQAKAKGYHLITYISSKTTTWPGLIIGDNCIVGENTTIGPCVEIGNNVTIGPNVVIGHHAVIKDHCFISPGVVILGGVTVGPYCLLGANSTIKEGGVIAAECLIGSGVTITNDTRGKGVYLGSSPELLSKSSDEVREWLTWPVTPRKQGSGSGMGKRRSSTQQPSEPVVFDLAKVLETTPVAPPMPIIPNDAQKFNQPEL